MSNHAQPPEPSEMTSPLEHAARSALHVLEKLMPPGTSYVLVVAMPDDEEAAVYANIDNEALMRVGESLRAIYDVAVEQ